MNTIELLKKVFSNVRERITKDEFIQRIMQASECNQGTAKAISQMLSKHIDEIYNDGAFQVTAKDKTKRIILQSNLF